MKLECMSELRKDRGLTQTQLAEALNMSQSTISAYERGEVQPDFETLIQISQFFNVSIEYLLGVSREMNPPRVNSSVILLKNLPEQAALEVETFVDYIKAKYKTK